MASEISRRDRIVISVPIGKFRGLPQCAAELCLAAAEALAQMPPDFLRPRYVIGPEVTIPGGEQETPLKIAVSWDSFLSCDTHKIVSEVARQAEIPESALRYDLNKLEQALPEVLANQNPGPIP